MKEIFYYFVLFVLSSLLTFPAISQEMKVGIVDMNRVFGEYHKTKETEKEIEKKRNTARKEVSERDNELKEKIKELKDLEREVADPVSSREVRAASQKRAQIIANEA
ncbi:MAG: OmpH family outer membrane protein, partial [Verrucomicrobiales bacterium]|nr:OmpH family outer membrane protein [Verrucomicrobiales bacterium]